VECHHHGLNVFENQTKEEENAEKEKRTAAHSLAW
jgi:hypothetical protein